MTSIPLYPHLLLRVNETIGKTLESRLSQDPNIVLDNDNTDELSQIKVTPDNNGLTDHYIFEYDNEDYPALLMNNPTILETYKTFDSKVIIKNGEIGQILHVFENDEAREAMKKEIIYTDLGSYFPSGITPPTQNIVKRRFLKSRKGKKKSQEKIERVIDEIESPWENVVNEEGIAIMDTREYTETIEEVIPFENWMMGNDGESKVLQVSDEHWPSLDAVIFLLQHPNLLVRQSDIVESKVREDAQNRIMEISENTKISNDASNTNHHFPTENVDSGSDEDSDEVIDDELVNNDKMEDSDGSSDDDFDNFDIEESLRQNNLLQTSNEQIIPDTNRNVDSLAAAAENSSDDSGEDLDSVGDDWMNDESLES